MLGTTKAGHRHLSYEEKMYHCAFTSSRPVGAPDVPRDATTRCHQRGEYVLFGRCVSESTVGQGPATRERMRPGRSEWLRERHPHRRYLRTVSDTDHVPKNWTLCGGGGCHY